MRASLLLAATLLVAAVPPRALAEDAQTSAPIGLTFTGSLAGGGTLGSSSHGLFEGELTAGYQLFPSLRPELGLILGLSPGTYAGLRPGIHYSFAYLPVYARAALDWAYPNGHGQLRWLFLGAGMELRLTGAFGIFAEGDTGIPLSSGAGVPLELRGGVSFRY